MHLIIFLAISLLPFIEGRSFEVPTTASDQTNNTCNTSKVVKLNIGGQKFWVLDSVLRQNATFFVPFLDGTTQVIKDEENCIFVEKDATTFSSILLYIRTGTLPPLSLDILNDMDFYGVPVWNDDVGLFRKLRKSRKSDNNFTRLKDLFWDELIKNSENISTYFSTGSSYGRAKVLLPPDIILLGHDYLQKYLFESEILPSYESEKSFNNNIRKLKFPKQIPSIRPELKSVISVPSDLFLMLRDDANSVQGYFKQHHRLSISIQFVEITVQVTVSPEVTESSYYGYSQTPKPNHPASCRLWMNSKTTDFNGRPVQLLLGSTDDAQPAYYSPQDFQYREYVREFKAPGAVSVSWTNSGINELSLM
jgi:hypothetical protein